MTNIELFVQATAVFESTGCGDILCAVCPNDKTLVTAGTSTVSHSFITDVSIAPLQVHYYSEALPTQHGYCVGVNTPKALQATTSEGLAQGPYGVARVGFEPATLQTQGTELTTELPHPQIQH